MNSTLHKAISSFYNLIYEAQAFATTMARIAQVTGQWVVNATLMASITHRLVRVTSKTLQVLGVQFVDLSQAKRGSS